MPDKTRAEFQDLTEKEVLAALDNPNSQNSTAVEVGRLVAGYTAILRAQPPALAEVQKVIQPGFPIEAVALRLASKLAGLPVVKDSRS